MQLLECVGISAGYLDLIYQLSDELVKNRNLNLPTFSYRHLYQSCKMTKTKKVFSDNTFSMNLMRQSGVFCILTIIK